MSWVPPPEPVTWTLPAALEHGSASYPTVTLRAPTAGDVLKALAITGSGAVDIDVTLRMIASISDEAVPYEALKKLPTYIVGQMSAYLDLFGGAPLPDPLERWRSDRVADAKATA